MKFFILLNFLFSFYLQANELVKPYAGASALQGKLLANKKCLGPAVIWVSKSSEILYQIESPIGGSFEFHLMPGEYDIASTTNNGCQVKKSFSVKKDEVKEIEIKLTK